MESPASITASATQSMGKRFRHAFGDTGCELPGPGPQDTEDGATDARLALSPVLQHKDARRHDPPRRTARGLRRCGCLLGLGRGPLVWSLGLPLLGSQHKTAAEEIEACPAIHLAFQHLQPIDVPFHQAVAPGQGDTGFDGRIVALETFRSALKRA